MRPGSLLGRAVGWTVAPIFGAISFARRARTFHPRGTTFHATVTGEGALGDRLAGPALVRFSGALWKHAEYRIDVLGCAIRFRRDARATAKPDEDDQDLLFATIRRPWTMPFAPFTTDVTDYLANDYFAVSPFDIGHDRRAYFRLRPTAPARNDVGSSRTQRLEGTVAQGAATLSLAVAEKPFGPWTPFASVTLERVADVDGEALRFRPYRAGRGVRPRGFVHALRVGVYTLSQRARPSAML